MTPAIFLDRDDTIVKDTGYLHEPQRVALMPHAARGLAALAKAGWPLVVVTNQSGIARGMYGEKEYLAVMKKLGELLAPHGVQLLGSYFCPHHPDFTGACYCRKPAAKLFRDASREHGIQLAQSWYIGDRWRDVAPAATLGGRAVLISKDTASEDARQAIAAGFPVAADLAAAAKLIVKGEDVVSSRKTAKSLSR